jgi:hypothetical protein
MLFIDWHQIFSVLVVLQSLLVTYNVLLTNPCHFFDDFYMTLMQTAHCSKANIPRSTLWAVPVPPKEHLRSSHPLHHSTFDLSPAVWSFTDGFRANGPIPKAVASDLSGARVPISEAQPSGHNTQVSYFWVGVPQLIWLPARRRLRSGSENRREAAAKHEAFRAARLRCEQESEVRRGFKLWKPWIWLTAEVCCVKIWPSVLQIAFLVFSFLFTAPTSDELALQALYLVLWDNGSCSSRCAFFVRVVC